MHPPSRRRRLALLVAATAVAITVTTALLPAGAPSGPPPAQAAGLGRLLDQERARLQDIIRRGGGHDPLWVIDQQIESFMAEHFGYTCPDPVTSEIIDWLLNKVPYVRASSLLACWQTTSPDPDLATRRAHSLDPSRYVQATVRTGGPAYWLNIRPTPSTQQPPVGRYQDGHQITIMCQTRGQLVDGYFGQSDLWDYVGDKDGQTRFVSDASVDTGTMAQVAPSCGPSITGY
jgi:hypothetical protein